MSHTQIENRPAEALGSGDELKTHIASYRAGGWYDGRLGLAYDLVCEALRESGEERPTRHWVSVEIDTLDRTLKGASQ